MKIILLGYSGLLGGHILSELAEHLKKNNNFSLICVGRSISKQPFRDKKINYVKWNFFDFNKSKLYFLGKENIIINCVGKNYNNESSLKKINVIFIKKLINYIKYNNILVRFIHLGSVSVYGAEKHYINKIVNITENSQTKPDDLYSKSKLESESCIRNFSKKNKEKFSFTILRIANVFSDTKNQNSFKLIKFLLKKGIWFNCSDQTNYHFVHSKDIAFAVLQCILYFKKSRDKTYIVSDDVNQLELHRTLTNRKIFKLLKIPISLKLIDLLIRYIPLPRMVLNFFLTISSQTTYNNQKIKRELNFVLRNSIKKFNN